MHLLDLFVLESLGTSHSLSGRYSKTYKCCVLFTGYCRKGREGRGEKRGRREGGGKTKGRRWGKGCEAYADVLGIAWLVQCLVTALLTSCISYYGCHATCMAAMQPVWLPCQPCDRGGP